MLIPSALARIDPVYVQVDRYGIEPATWLAVTVGLGAVIQHAVRYYLKKRSNPDMEYDPGYMYTTLLSIVALCQMTAAIPVVELTTTGVIYAFFSGMGINEGACKVTKIKGNN